MIIVNKCYEIVTQESAEQGEVAKSGFEYEDQEFSFRDLVSEMREYTDTSSHPPLPSDWLTSEPDQNYRTGEYTSYSLHYGHTNKPRSLKYWEKAMRKAGLLK